MKSRVVKALGVYAVVMLSIVGLIGLTQYLTVFLYKEADLYAAPQLNYLGCLLLLNLSWALITHYTLNIWLFSKLKQLELSIVEKIGLQVLMAAVATGFDIAIGFHLPFLTTGLVVLSFLSLFDLYLDNYRSQQSLAWPFAWLVWYAGIGAVLLFFFNLQNATPGNGYVIPITLFAMCFWLLLFQLIILALFSRDLDPFMLRLPSLRYRIQLAIVGLFLIAFLVIGSFTLWQIKDLVQGQKSSLSQFTGVLISSYVFFLLISGVIGIFIAKTITNPLQQIEEGLKRLKLGNTEPLVWKNPDEIGILVDAYNNSVAELQENFLQLQAAERKAAWQEMAKQVAHEIKNPLTPMRLSVQHLQRATQMRPEETPQLLEKVCKTILEQIDSLTRIANEFAHFAKMPQPEHSVFDLRDALQSVYTLFEEQQSPSFQLHLETSPTPLPIYADREQLTRVLTNLVQNARQAIPEQRVGQVALTTKKMEDRIITQVTDNGQGIPQDIQPKVFLPNFTTKSSGMGLGLAMAKNIVEAAGGKIYFTTQENVGTTFFVEMKVFENAAS
jgi:signal transduction histidine kinase